MSDPLPARVIYEDPDHWIWCPSLVQADDGRWHLFASRWPKRLPFHPGWLVASEVIRAEAERPEGPFRFAEVVLWARGSAWWDGRSSHNPRVLRDGSRWVLFYMGSTHPFADVPAGAGLHLDDPRVVTARWRKRIGVAVADRPEGPWTRPDQPALDVRPGAFDAWLCSNPAPCRAPDGGWTMIYKARAELAGPKHGPMTLGLARATRAEGPWTREAQPVFPAPGLGEVEDPFLWRSARGFELLAKDMDGRLGGVRHSLIRAWSPDARDWRLDDPALFSDRRLRWPDGRVEQVASLERPSLLFDGDRPTHLVAAAADGSGHFQGMTRSYVVLADVR
jgi:hypothetical protein